MYTTKVKVVISKKWCKIHMLILHTTTFHTVMYGLDVLFLGPVQIRKLNVSLFKFCN